MQMQRTPRHPSRCSFVGLNRRQIARMLMRFVSAEGVMQRGIPRLTLFEEMTAEAMALVEIGMNDAERNQVVTRLREALAHAERPLDAPYRPFKPAL